MAKSTGTRAYQRTQVLTARPETLQLMLYEGAVRFVEEARLALAANDRETACLRLERARLIVLYLAECLRPDAAPELCARMASAYQFIFGRLVDAGLTASQTSLDEALECLRFLRDTWAELLRRRPARDAPPSPSQGGATVTRVGGEGPTPPDSPSPGRAAPARIRLTG